MVSGQGTVFLDIVIAAECIQNLYAQVTKEEHVKIVQTGISNETKISRKGVIQK